MTLPLLLLSLAFTAGWVMAYGTSATWGGWGPHGVSFILWSRQMQWVLTAFTVIFSLGLIGMVAAGRRRAWWLIGLVPVVMLFGHRFVTGPASNNGAADNPPIVTADKAGFLLPADHVIGVVWNNTAYALPFDAMYHTPLVVLQDRSGPLVVVWSVYANRALAIAGSRDVRGRDLEIVSSPVDAVILYNSRLGQFINGITGLTPQGTVPTGFEKPLQTWKMSWADWKALHPATLVMAPYEPTLRPAPKDAVAPMYAVPQSTGTRRVCVVATTQPIAVPTEAITDKPLNLTAGQTPVVLVRVDGVVRAFRRQVQEDLRPRFYQTADAKHPTVVWTDDDTTAGWNADGLAVDGPAGIKGIRLVPIPVEDDLDWAVEKFWLPGLILENADDLNASVASAETKPAVDKHGDPKKPKPKKPKRAAAKSE
jgi:hypothetical protein